MRSEAVRHVEKGVSTSAEHGRPIRLNAFRSRPASQPDLRVILVRRPDMAQPVQRGGEEFEQLLQAHEVFDDVLPNAVPTTTPR